MMPGDPNEKRIYIRFKDPAYVEQIELAAHANGQTRQEWAKSVLMAAARGTKEKAHLDKTVRQSQLIVRKVLEKVFPKETHEAKLDVEGFLRKLAGEDDD